MHLAFAFAFSPAADVLSTMVLCGQRSRPWDFFSDTHTTYYGKALAVVRGGDVPGKITVTVKAKGLLAKTLELEVI